MYQFEALRRTFLIVPFSTHKSCSKNQPETQKVPGAPDRGILRLDQCVLLLLKLPSEPIDNGLCVFQLGRERIHLGPKPND